MKTPLATYRLHIFGRVYHARLTYFEALAFCRLALAMQRAKIC